MRRYGQLIGLLALVCLSACDGTSFQSSVPAYPVRVVINTKTMFTDFMPENTNAYITVIQDGYYENGTFKQPVTVTDAWGYGGVVTYVSIAGYVAYDLACPNCAAHGHKSPCEMDGIYAICPRCGEQYDIGSGYAMPQKSISKEALRQLNIIVSEDKLTITQKQ